MSHLRSPNKVSEFVQNTSKKGKTLKCVQCQNLRCDRFSKKKKPNSHLRESKEPLTAVIIALEDDNASIKSCFFFSYFFS